MSERSCSSPVLQWLLSAPWALSGCSSGLCATRPKLWLMLVASSLPWSCPCLEQGSCAGCWVTVGCSLLQKCPAWSMFLAAHVPSQQDSPCPIVQPSPRVHGNVLPCRAAGPDADQGWCCRGCSSRMCDLGGLPQSFWVVQLWDLISYLVSDLGHSSGSRQKGQARCSPCGGVLLEPSFGRVTSLQWRSAVSLRVLHSSHPFPTAGQPWPLPTKDSPCRRH